MIFCTKMHNYKPLNVTEPDFRKKESGQISGKKTAKKGLFGNYEKFDH